ncbi:unnamed protein product [Caenorhabditis brenneri]
MPPNSNHWKTDPEYINLLNFLIEKTENAESPLNLQPLVREFKEKTGAAQTVNCLQMRIDSFRKLIHSFEHIDINTKIRMMFALGASVDANFLKQLEKNALVEVDEKNRIIHYKANDGSSEFRGDHSLSAKCRRKESSVAMNDDFNSFESFEDDSIGDNNSDGTGNNETPKTSKRKADASGPSSSKRTKPLSDKSMNPGEIDDNFSHDDPSRVELKPFRGSLMFPNKIEKDSDIHQIPKPRLQATEAPIKKECEEAAHTPLQTILKAFKSLILSLDTPGLSQFLSELDTKIMEAGRGVEISNKELIVAMEFMIVKLSKHSALQSSEDSISLRDILLLLRSIILTSSFNGLEVILEMLKENIEQLKDQDKKVPVSKVECILRATLDNITF